jgi:predicted aconitase
MLKLTDEEKRMLNGEDGEGTAKAMDMVLKWGEVYGAEKLVDVSNTHTSPGEPIEWLKEMSEGARARTYGTIHPFPIDRERWQIQGIKSEWVQKMEPYWQECIVYYKKLGLIPNFTCCPYMVGNVPAFRSNSNFFGSEAVLLTNSYFGARNPRTGGPACFISALTGKAPYEGLMIDANRYGELLFEPDPVLNMEGFNHAELGLYGYYVGIKAQEKVCVINGVRKRFDFEEFKYLTAPMATSGSVALCHIVGTTPEAQSLEQAFGPKKALEKITIGRKEMKEMWRKLNTTDSDDVDMVLLGCPHLSIPELKALAAMLEGKKVKEGKRFFIAIGDDMLNIAKKMDLDKIIEASGAKILTGVCNGPLTPWDHMVNKPKVVATNSGKAAHYIYAGSGMTVNVRFGSTEDCVNSMITGKYVDTGRWTA